MFLPEIIRIVAILKRNYLKNGQWIVRQYLVCRHILTLHNRVITLKFCHFFFPFHLFLFLLFLTPLKSFDIFPFFSISFFAFSSKVDICLFNLQLSFQ